MLKGIIFDLDMTLVNTLVLYNLRKNRDWQNVYKNIHKTTVFDGIIDLIEFLKPNYKIGIVTSSPSKYALKVISHHNLDIPLLIAYHDTQNHKPHPQPILKGIEKLSLNPSEVISIGDECKDIEATNKAGSISIGVSWGLDKINDLQNANPDDVCQSVNELQSKILYYASFKETPKQI